MRQSSIRIRAALAARMLAGCFLVLASSGASAGEVDPDIPETAVPSRHFLMTLRPVDEESRDARAADLYMTRLPGAGWRLVGACEVSPTPGGPRFHRAVSVPVDGAYYFAASAGDAAGKAPPPGPATAPQMRVIVDTRAPDAELLAPTGGETLRPASALLLRWRAEDEHLADAPVAIDWSGDAGRNWRPVAEDLPAEGSHEWTVPAAGGTRLWIRLTARDTAGNAAVATTRRALLVDAEPALRPSAEAPSAMVRAAGEAAPPRAELALGQLPDEPVEGLPAEPPEMSEEETETHAAPEPAPDPVRPETAPASEATADETPADDDPAETLRREGYAGSAYLAYVMAGNLVRQGRLKDSVRYYRAAVEADPGFGDAWADLAMVYREVGHFAPAHKAAEAALETDPGRSLYHHVRGEVFFAEAWDLLEGSDDYETLREGGKLAGRAVTAFGRAIELAEADERLAARADSFFRLGEICYFINQDRLGARAYWARILDLHAPGPMLFEVTHAPDDSVRSEALESYARLTEMELELETWKRWAREYLAQLDREPDPAAEAPPAGAPRPTLPDSARESGAPSSAPQPDPVRTAPTAPYAPQGEYLRPGYGSAPALREPPARTPGRAGRGKSFRIFD